MSLFLRTLVYSGVTLMALGDAGAAVTLPSILSNHMVLQRNEPVHIWGWSAPSEVVHVTFRDEKKTVTANATGAWDVYLAPGEAGGPYSLQVDGENKIVLDDILLGDVWIASGQSNMEMPMKGFGPTMPIAHSAEEIAAANYPQIRLARLARASSIYPLDDALMAQGWEVCQPGTVDSFSAVGYFFARDLQRVEKVPIGIIDSTWGGTPVEAWTSLGALSASPALLPVFSFFNEMARDHAANLRVAAAENAEDTRLRAEAKRPPPRRNHPDLQMWQPGGLFNGMIAPLTSLRIKGVLWYQGESNTGSVQRAATYEENFKTMIDDWRAVWKEGDFPFLFVQISAYGENSGGVWPVVREAQRRTLALNRTAMVVSTDVGEPKNIHPANKQDVGARLSLAARAVAYAESVESSGPLFREAISSGAAMQVLFNYAKGLQAKGETLAGFEVAGPDRKFVPATAEIVAGTVIVHSAKTPQPSYVRYAWAASPDGNLFNASELPASPFTSDPSYRDLPVTEGRAVKEIPPHPSS